MKSKIVSKGHLHPEEWKEDSLNSEIKWLSKRHSLPKEGRGRDKLRHE
jgi:hypothetical protein